MREPFAVAVSRKDKLILRGSHYTMLVRLLNEHAPTALAPSSWDTMVTPPGQEAGSWKLSDH